MIDHASFVKRIADKLNYSKGVLTQNGQRNNQGFSETATRIMKGLDNLYWRMGNEKFDPIQSMFTSFSARPGLNDVTNVEGVDVIDINIMASVDSVMSYLVAERGMSKPTDIAYYQTLDAINDAGGFNAGDTVFSPFLPQSGALNLGAVTTTKDITGTQGDVTVTLDAFPVAKKNVTINFVDANGKVIATGKDVNGADNINGKETGTIYFSNGGIATSAYVQYETGDVVIKGLVTASTAGATTSNITAVIDRTAERDGANTLRVKPRTTTVTLTAKPNRIVLENSYEDIAYIDKQSLDLQAAGVTMSYGKRAIHQLLEVYTQFLDIISIATVFGLSLELPESPLLDITGYTLAASEASTKNDYINQYMLQLTKTLQDRCNHGQTCYLVDGAAAIVLANNPMYFIKNSNFDKNLDGMIGTYNGFPVIRHHILNNRLNPSSGTETYGYIGAIFKDPSGQVSPAIYGEFLSPYSISPALNFDNPSQFANGLYSESTVQPLVSQCCAYMKVKLTGASS